MKSIKSATQAVLRWTARERFTVVDGIGFVVLGGFYQSPLVYFVVAMVVMVIVTHVINIVVRSFVSEDYDDSQDHGA